MLLADVALAVALAVLVLIITPGLAFVAIFALLALIVCAASFAIDSRRRTRRVRSARRPPHRPGGAPRRASSEPRTPPRRQ